MHASDTQETGVEIWAVLLVGVALLGFQLRRNSRHDAVRFSER